MRCFTLAVVLAAFGFSAVGAADAKMYVIEPPDILRLDVTGLPKKAQAVKSECLVRPDGTISLDAYGIVSVSGRTADEARTAIAEHLATHLKTNQNKLEVRVEVTGFNSKRCQVVCAGKNGQQVQYLPIAGNETVASVVRQIQGAAELAAAKRVWIARPRPAGVAPDQILLVDWKAIASDSSSATNYQILPNDRVYIGIAPPK